MVNQADVVESRLEAARKELLDLGLRNHLLNYRLLRSRGLEVVDELPAEVFRILVLETRKMSFVSGSSDGDYEHLGQPEEEEAGGLAARHTDTRLQTALSSSELQARLLSTYHLANTIIQEQGVNTLFLALGTGAALAWFTREGFPAWTSALAAARLTRPRCRFRVLRTLVVRPACCLTPIGLISVEDRPTNTCFLCCVSLAA